MPELSILFMSVNVVLTAVAIVLILLRRRSTATVGPDGSDAIRLLGTEIRQDLSGQRGEVGQSLAEGQRLLESRLDGAMESQASRLDRDFEARRVSQIELRNLVQDGLTSLREIFHRHAETASAADNLLRSSIDARFDELRGLNDSKLEKIREAVEKFEQSNAESLSKNADRVQALIDSNSQKQVELQEVLRSEFNTLKEGNEAKLAAVKAAIELLQESNGEKQAKLQESIRVELERLRIGNEAKLEKMRETVDEKLQGTLEKRLGESFALVSERLELVQRGLGEMQSLASDVGGLKRVLTNVKSRGSWGEVQLSRQLEDMLTQDQFARNVVVKESTTESVEFAVKLPGREPDESVYLPIDSKLPQEDYERLLNAQEAGDKTLIEIATKGLERAILAQAKVISSKYINPPRTTDFAIMYLPTEGLFAEVVRQPGLASRLQNDHHVLITGPTTLMSLLNSLQMGFRTLAIERRSSEVWKILSAAKLEFQKYGQVWDKLDKQLATAQKTVAEVRTRTRSVERKLRDVETLEVEDPSKLAVDLLDGDDIADIVGLDALPDEATEMA